MAKSRLRGGKKAHNKKVKARNSKISADKKWAEDFMKNYTVNPEMAEAIQKAKQAQAPVGDLGFTYVPPVAGTIALTPSGEDNEQLYPLS